MKNRLSVGAEPYATKNEGNNRGAEGKDDTCVGYAELPMSYVVT